MKDQMANDVTVIKLWKESVTVVQVEEILETSGEQVSEVLTRRIGYQRPIETAEQIAQALDRDEFVVRAHFGKICSKLFDQGLVEGLPIFPDDPDYEG